MAAVMDRVVTPYNRKSKTRTEQDERIQNPKSIDRPGWIPPEILHGWDDDPFAYQTEEELMPAGGLHGKLLAYIVELVRHTLEEKGLMFLIDTFLLYRDENNVKQRIGPDLLLMPFRDPPPSAYDLETEALPRCVVEVTSPKSRLNDLERKAGFYLNLGIPAYLAIDAITANKQVRKQIILRLWRLVDGEGQEVKADAQGGFTLPEMGMRIYAEGQRLRFVDLATGKVTLDSGELGRSLTSLQQMLTSTQQTLTSTQQTLTSTQRTLTVTEQALLTAQAALAKEQAARLQSDAALQQALLEIKKLRGEK
ncbi:MAG: Uma2 family endonuclease [Caldilinea sp. CFX5]|nr:Uma2 family endonuclease [Caldilinea sp. CFX5]